MPDNDGITLQIKINPRLIERLFYIAIIITLAVFLILGTFCSKSSCKTEEIQDTENTTQQTQTTETTTQGQEEESVISDIQEDTTPEAEPPANETSDTTTTTGASSQQTVSYSGDVEMTINQVMSEVKGDSTKYGKITGVRFTINNEKSDFMPLVKVYAYEDGDTSSVFATTPRAERIYSELKLGKSMTQELDITSQQFINLNEYVVCKVVVYNKATGKEVGSATEKFKIS